MLSKPPVRGLKFATPVKALRFAPMNVPPPDPSSTGTALTRRGFPSATRTGSRERGSGGGRRWLTGTTKASAAHVWQKGRFGNRLGNSVGLFQGSCGVADFRSKVEGFSRSILSEDGAFLAGFRVPIWHLFE
jgi:hypothetical protein